jgi:predicted AlkP superfamily pyrophosphatase or phosphodiesterase
MAVRSCAPRRLVQAGLAAMVVLLTSASPQLQQSAAPRAPRLVVLLIVDQMRADYLEWYDRLFTAGFRRLETNGAWFTRAAYPYLNTVTCAGHSTIGTGTFPFHHGMVLNGWPDRATSSVPGCTEDTTARDISYNGLATGTGNSARNILRPSLGEQLREHGRGRAVALSMKPRAAIPLVGHQADAVIWFDERGGWLTSTAFSNKPVPFLEQFIAAHPLGADRGKVWTKSLDAAAYVGDDDVESEHPPAGTTRTFPHALDVAGSQNTGAETFFTRWERSPFADEYLEQMTEAAIDGLSLGRSSGTDFLGVSFSALDLVGHAFGPRSHEAQDLLVRLDATIGRLLDHLDRHVGPGNYVVGFSADHGVADLPEIAGEGGRLPAADVKTALERVFVPVLGGGDHVSAVVYSDVYLMPNATARLRTDGAVRKAVTDALFALPAVSRVLIGDDLVRANARSSSDPATRAAALSYYPERSGDVIIVPKEHWLLSGSVTTHGTLYAYDQQVPLILLGASIRPGRYAASASPADLSPTLASIARIGIAPTDGRVLKEAVEPRGVR